MGDVSLLTEGLSFREKRNSPALKNTELFHNLIIIFLFLCRKGFVSFGFVFAFFINVIADFEH